MTARATTAALSRDAAVACIIKPAIRALAEESLGVGFNALPNVLLTSAVAAAAAVVTSVVSLCGVVGTLSSLLAPLRGRGATSITGELSQGTLKMILPHAYRRSDWVAAKAIVLVLCAAAFSLVLAVGALGTTQLVHGLDDVTRTIPAGFGEAEDITDRARTESGTCGGLSGNHIG